MRSFPIFFVLFLVIPIVEIFFLIKVGETIGAWPTIFLVVLTAVIGAGLLRQQGLSVLTRFQNNMGQGKLPAQEMVEGIILAVGGALLMTPGFVTDTVGFICLLPFSRQFIAKKVIERSTIQMKAQVSGFAQGSHQQQDDDIIEAEYTEVVENAPELSNKKNHK